MKDWTAEQAIAAQAAYVAAGGSGSDPTGPISQWAALHDIDRFRAAYEAGNTFAILHAVAECARCGLVMPKWVVRGFLDHYRDVIHYKVKSLDEAFGRYLPKRAKLPAHRKHWEKGILAYAEVQRLSDAGIPIDESLFNKAGESLGIGGSKVRDYYYEWQRKLTYKKPAE